MAWFIRAETFNPPRTYLLRTEDGLSVRSWPTYEAAEGHAFILRRLEQERYAHEPEKMRTYTVIGSD